MNTIKRRMLKLIPEVRILGKNWEKAGKSKSRWHIRSMKVQDRKIRKKAKINKMQIDFWFG